MSATLDFIHRFVPGASERTILLLHGTGGTENDMLALGRTLEPAASLLSPRGRVLEHGMPRFFRRLAEGVFDEADIIRRATELAQFLESAVAHYRLDAGKIVAVGYSNGANIAAALLLLHPGVLSGAALLRPMVPLIPETMPQLDSVPVLILSGSRDPIVPAENTRALLTLLQRAGAEVTVHVENTGHGLTQETIETARSWLSAQAK